jgi:hypothetical protein
MKKILFILNLLFSSNLGYLNAQQWNVFGGNNITSIEYLGGDGTSTIPLNLKTINSYPINFYTDNVQRVTILGSTNPGFVGIGDWYTPNFKLDIDAGDINLNGSAFSYRIGNGSNSKPVLSHYGHPSCINVGVDA